MRLRQEVLLCGVLMVSGTLTSPAAAADASWLCRGIDFAVRVASGPCPVNDTARPSCSDPGPFTGIEYEIAGPAEYAATLVTRNNKVSLATGSKVFAPCAGDPMTLLGRNSCHELAVAINPDLLKDRFWVVVDGVKGAVETSMVLKKGWCAQSFTVAGLGVGDTAGPNPYRLAQRMERVEFKGCAVDFEIDPSTDEVLSARLTDESLKLGCESPSQSGDGVIEPVSAGEAELTVRGESLGLGKFGDGYFSSGEASCTTRIIGGKLYTWGKPCP